MRCASIFSKNYIKTEAKIYLDGKEVENFFADQVKVIAVDEAQSGEILKLYDSFSGKITLTDKQAKRLIKAMKKVQRKWSLKQKLYSFKQERR